MIIKIEPGSIAEELEIEPGDRIIGINSKAVEDVFDYRYLIKDEYLELEIEKANGERWLLEIEKDEDDELGLVFETGLMDNAKSCANKCMFCFIDQLPKGMRSTLYFKDDDSRLSFLQGNYVTLTNMSETDIDRIIFYHLSPINISVHSTDPELRVRMLKNPKAAGIMEQLQRLNSAGIEMNFQVVLCKNVNDGKQLDQTIETLARLGPKAGSLSVVPAGLTRFRDNLEHLTDFSAAEAAEVIDKIQHYQKRFLVERKTRFVFAADEFYLKSGRALPDFESYEDFPQIENGVGMLASFKHEFYGALEAAADCSAADFTIITGTAAAVLIKELVEAARRKFHALKAQVIVVENLFFGASVNVSGLLTGQDIAAALQATKPRGVVLVPANALRAGDTVFLDNMDISELCVLANARVEAVRADGAEFLERLTRGAL